MSNKTFLGLDEKITGSLAYAGLFVTGIIFLVAEKENKFVRFCALQSTVLFLALCICGTVIGWIPIIGGLVSSMLGIVTVIAWIYLMVTAYSGKEFRVPVLGDIVAEQINK